MGFFGGDFHTSWMLLVSHLHQSACRSALFTTNQGMVPTNRNTFTGGITNSSIHAGEDAHPSNDVVHRLLPTNAFGDIIAAEDNENSEDFQVFHDNEDSDEDEIIPFQPPATDNNTTQTDNGRQLDALEQSTNPISTILEGESFNVPVGSDDRLIPMLKMIKAIRESGAPLGLLDTLVKIIKEEWQLGRMEISNLCTHKTALRRISKMFPLLPSHLNKFHKTCHPLIMKRIIKTIHM